MDKDALINSLQSRRGNWPAIARSAGVSYSWIVKFAGGKIPDPRLGSLTRLQEAMLSSQPVSSPSGVSAPQ